MRKILYNCPLSALKGIDIGLKSASGENIHEGDIVRRDAYYTNIVKFGYHVFSTGEYTNTASYGFYLQSLSDEGIFEDGHGVVTPFFEDGYGEPDKFAIVGSIYKERDRKLNNEDKSRARTISKKYIGGVETFDFEKQAWINKSKS